jgi:hypothetical protein
MKTEGGCLCKSVRFAVEGEPLVTRICWCRLCQYLSGGNGMVSVCFRSEGLNIGGKVQWFESIADSGNRMERGFCPSCATPLFSKTEARPHLVFIRAGSLDNPNLVTPVQAIWTAEAPDWACFDPNVPQVPGQPPPPV